jgi:uncharacterized protein (DUF305 family)
LERAVHAGQTIARNEKISRPPSARRRAPRGSFLFRRQTTEKNNISTNNHNLPQSTTIYHNQPTTTSTDNPDNTTHCSEGHLISEENNATISFINSMHVSATSCALLFLSSLSTHSINTFATNLQIKHSQIQSIARDKPR